MAKTDARRGVCAALGSPNQYGDATPDRYDGSQRPKSIRDKSVHVGSMPRIPGNREPKSRAALGHPRPTRYAPQQNAASSLATKETPNKAGGPPIHRYPVLMRG